MIKRLLYTYGRHIAFITYFSVAIPSFIYFQFWALIPNIILGVPLVLFLIWWEPMTIEYIKNYIIQVNSLFRGEYTDINRDSFLYPWAVKFFKSSEKNYEKRQDFLYNIDRGTGI